MNTFNLTLSLQQRITFLYTFTDIYQYILLVYGLHTHNEPHLYTQSYTAFRHAHISAYILPIKYIDIFAGLQKFQTVYSNA